MGVCCLCAGAEDKMMEFLRERDTSGAINDLLQMEAESPEKMLDDHRQVSVAA